MNSEHKQKRDSGHPDTFGDNSQLIEQYRLFVETADRTSDRRASTNNFFLTIHTIFITGSGFLLQAKDLHQSFKPLTTLFVAATLMCVLWWILIFSYKNINKVKFEIIHDMEKYLPFKPFTQEWEKLGVRKTFWKHIPFTSIELFIPLAFIILYTVIWIWARELCLS